MTIRILIVDDEQTFLDSVELRLNMDGYNNVTPCSDPTHAAELFDASSFDVALLDITMPKMDGLQLLQVIKEKSPQTECIMVTANDNLESVIKAVKMGAYDYLVKPIMPEQLTLAINQALERKLLLEALLLKSEKQITRSLKLPEAFKDIITGHKDVIKLLHEAELHAASEIPILIRGETGVGKELLAQAIHKASRRSGGPFIAVNMLALSPNLFESEFFGHAKGSFTGAEKDKRGYLAQAKGGTLFLDEIGDLSMELQGKLLRILQEGEFTPVGKTQAEKMDVRFVAATNQDLEKRVEKGVFRKDLYYRLQFAQLTLPPLKDRTDDIPMLVKSFLEHSSRPEASLTENAEFALFGHDWPGNIRELKGVIEAAANLAEEGKITAEMIRVPQSSRKIETVSKHSEQSGPLETLAEVEKRYILNAYKIMDRNKSKTAKVLGIGLQTLYRKLKEYDVS